MLQRRGPGSVCGAATIGIKGGGATPWPNEAAFLSILVDDLFCDMVMMHTDEEFWMLAARKGLPWFRFFRRPVPTGQLDAEFQRGRLFEEWQSLKVKIRVGDQIWPFCFHLRSRLGMRRGYLVLRRGKPIGGIVTVVS